MFPIKLYNENNCKYKEFFAHLLACCLLYQGLSNVDNVGSGAECITYTNKNFESYSIYAQTNVRVTPEHEKCTIFNQRKSSSYFSNIL